MTTSSDEPLCSACGFPLKDYPVGLRHFGTHTAHVEYYCLQRLRHEIDTLRSRSKELAGLLLRLKGENVTFLPGDVVKKRSGSAWQGKVVGWYSTILTPEGYAVESDTHHGSVQIYPVAALELLKKD